MTSYTYRFRNILEPRKPFDWYATRRCCCAIMDACKLAVFCISIVTISAATIFSSGAGATPVVDGGISISKTLLLLLQSG